MVNKRAQMFSLYLVFITLIMMGVVIGLYFKQQNEVQSMVISPMRVLSERDALEIFEAREMDLVKNSLNDASGTFGTQDFIDSFRKSFFYGLSSNKDMMSFLRLDVYKDGHNLDFSSGDTITKGIYPPSKTYYQGESLVFTRDKLYKEFKIDGNSKKVVFPTDFYFEFEREYNINYVNGKFEVSIK